MYKLVKRKKKHLKFVRNYIYDLKYDIINKNLDGSRNGFTKEINKSLTIKCKLLLKYERRYKLLNY